jgi:hypothetical protein
VRVVVILAVLVGCASPGEPIRDWVLDVDGGPHDVHVTMPSRLAELPLHEVAFHLRADVPLAPAQRGQALTLSLDCYHGRLSATAGGIALEDLGDVGVGEHRFIIAASVGEDAISIELAARADQTAITYGIGTVPRLQVGARHEPSARAVANRWLANSGIVICGVLAIVFGVIFLVDRSAKSDGLFAVGSACALLAWLAFLDLVSIAFAGIAGAVAGPALMFFVTYEFEVAPPPRWLVALYVPSGVAAVVGLFAMPIGVVGGAAGACLVVPWSIYFVRRLVPLVRAGSRRLNALLVLGAVVVNTLALVPLVFNLVAASVSSELALLPGLHTELFLILGWASTQAIVLGRRHASRRHALEHANVELRRQVAERSKDLADALTKLAQQPRAPAADRTIDGRYRVIRQLGAGGMGNVHEVERVSDGKRLALKTVRGRADADLLARLAREAQVAAEVHHPNLVSVLDVGIADGALFLVMPLVDGGSLDREQARYGDARWARPILAQIAAGLAALHERGIVHRDLKPANVLLDRGVARIADFGLAAMRDAPAEVADASSDPALAPTKTGKLRRPGLTQAGDVFGTPQYMAPELADGVHDVQPSSDVFAFGLIACELLTGRAAFVEPPLLARLAGKSIPEPLSDGLEPVVARCLALDASQRPTAAELAAALAPF